MRFPVEAKIALNSADRPPLDHSHQPGRRRQTRLTDPDRRHAHPSAAKCESMQSGLLSLIGCALNSCSFIRC